MEEIQITISKRAFERAAYIGIIVILIGLLVHAYFFKGECSLGTQLLGDSINANERELLDPVDDGGEASDPVATPEATCSDGIKNQDETNIDCGGACTSVNGGYWWSGECHLDPEPEPEPDAPEETCNDGIVNQDETNIDCGGVCTNVNGQYYVDGECQTTDPNAPTPGVFTANVQRVLYEYFAEGDTTNTGIVADDDMVHLEKIYLRINNGLGLQYTDMDAQLFIWDESDYGENFETIPRQGYTVALVPANSVTQPNIVIKTTHQNNFKDFNENKKIRVILYDGVTKIAETPIFSCDVSKGGNIKDC